MQVHFACNNPDNGMFACGFDAVWLGTEAHLEGPHTSMAPLPNNRVRIGRCIFDHQGWQEWVGNWCWDALEIKDVKRLLEHLRKRGFQCVQGASGFFDAFNEGREFDLAMLDD